MKISSCCGASIIENTDLCGDCKEHCGETEDIFNHTLGLSDVIFKGTPEEFFDRASVDEEKNTDNSLLGKYATNPMYK